MRKVLTFGTFCNSTYKFLESFCFENPWNQKLPGDYFFEYTLTKWMAEKIKNKVWFDAKLLLYKFYVGYS